MFPVSFKKLALEATPNNVPAVSNRFTKRKETITLIMAISSAPKISNSRNTGVTSGGRANIPSNSTKFRIMLKRVTVRMPIIIAPGIFLIESMAMSKNPKPANKVLEFVKSPKLRKVAPSEIIIPPFFRPINPIKDQHQLPLLL